MFTVTRLKNKHKTQTTPCPVKRKVNGNSDTILGIQAQLFKKLLPFASTCKHAHRTWHSGLVIGNTTSTTREPYKVFMAAVFIKGQPRVNFQFQKKVNYTVAQPHNVILCISDYKGIIASHIILAEYQTYSNQ